MSRSDENNNGVDPSLEPFVEEIQREALRKQETIIERAEQEARQILQKAERQVEAYRLSTIAKTERQATINTRRILSQARVEIRRRELQVKAQKIQQVLDAALKRIQHKDQPNDHAILLEQLAAEALIGLGEENAVLLVAKEDRQIFNDVFLLKVVDLVATRLKFRPEVTVKERCDAGTKGISGVIAQSPTGRVVFDNSLAARMRRKQESFRVIASGQLLNEE